ncbi:hypothetical protein BVY03_03880 [bacterium K02(2017)]|nr:hypothetical protein BVY03_03880 [bacterium K02(2017)]
MVHHLGNKLEHELRPSPPAIAPNQKTNSIKKSSSTKTPPINQFIGEQQDTKPAATQGPRYGRSGVFRKISNRSRITSNQKTSCSGNRGRRSWNHENFDFDLELVNPKNIHAANKKLSFTPSALLWAAKHSDNLPVLEPSSILRGPVKARCSGFTRELLSLISTIPNTGNIDAWNLRLELLNYVEFNDRPSMRHLYQNMPRQVSPSYYYKEALKEFYRYANNSSPAVITFWNESTRTRHSRSRHDHSDNISHVGLSLGALVSTEIVSGNQSLAKALKNHFKMANGMDFLFETIEVSYNGKKATYNQKYHEFMIGNNIVRLSRGKHKVQIKDIRVAHQLGRQQGFTSLIKLMGRGTIHPADILPIDKQYLIPGFENLAEQTYQNVSLYNPKRITVKHNLTSITGTFKLKKGETLNQALQRNGIPRHHINLYHLYLADRQGLTNLRRLHQRMTFTIPNFKEYADEISKRGGKVKVAKEIASIHYPDNSHKSYVVTGMDLPANMLRHLFGANFIISLTDEIINQLLSKVYQENGYSLGNWPDTTPNDWSTGQIFTLSNEKINILKATYDSNMVETMWKDIEKSRPKITITIDGDKYTFSDTLVNAVIETTQDPSQQAALLGLYGNENAQGGFYSNLENILQKLGKTTSSWVDTTGALETNIALYSSQIGISKEDARHNLRTHIKDSVHFAHWLLGGYERKINRMVKNHERKFKGSRVSLVQKRMAKLDAYNAGSLKKSAFRAFQYMVYELCKEHNIPTTDDSGIWDFGIDRFGDQENFEVDGFAGKTTARQVKKLLDQLIELDYSEDLELHESQYRSDTLKIKKGTQLTSGALYDFIAKLYQSEFNQQPLLFLGEKESKKAYVKNNYALNANRYTRDIIDILKY